MMKALKVIIFCIAIFQLQYVNAQMYSSEYDKTIDKLIPKAKKNKLNEKQLDQLIFSYHHANESDHKRIMELKESGQPNIWIEIYFRIENINHRQNKIKKLPDNIKTAMNFKLLNFDNEIKNSREKAELYICAKANLLLKDPSEENITEAKTLVDKLCDINPQNKNIDKLKLKLAIVPSKHILFRIATPTELNLPDNFAQLALDFDSDSMFGIPFDIVPDENTDYDLMIRIMIEKKTVSPERIDAVTFEESNGDKTAKVTDKTMNKSAMIKGNIEIIDIKNERILINTPFDIASTFVFEYAEISGDASSCSAKTIELSNKEVIDFPSDESLLKDTARKLNHILKSHYQEK